MAKTRGRIFFLLDVRPEVGEFYRAAHPSLRGRPMFGWYDATTPEAAVAIVQDPLVDGATIRDLVKAGPIVRTRIAGNTIEARNRDYRKARAAMASGAQAVSTDYYPGAPSRADRDCTVTLPHGAMARCNPVRRAPTCAPGVQNLTRTPAVTRRPTSSNPRPNPSTL